MQGGCHCGSIRFETQGEPKWVGACYCVDCRKISGAPYMVFADFADKDVSIQGVPKAYRSSENVIRSFCENCGSPLSYRYINEPDHLFISVGLFDDAASLAPQHHIFVEQKLPWVKLDKDVSES